MHARNATSRLSAHTRRFTALSAGVFLATGLASCTPAPKPDTALVETFKEAQFDSQALSQSAPEVSALRSEHAAEIGAEISRLCGFTDEGILPESCAVAIPDIAAAPTGDVEGHITRSQDLILDTLDDIPAESVPLLTEQFIEQARFSSPEEAHRTENPTLRKAEVDTAQQLLTEEYAAAWALGVALAHVDPSLHSVTQEAVDHHRDRAAILRSILDPLVDTEPSQPGYDLANLPEPTDATSALELVRLIQGHTLTSWHAAAVSASSDGWRTLTTAIAGDTSRDSAPFNN